MFQADLDSVPGCLGEGPPPRYRGSLSGSLLWAEPLGQQLRAIYEPAALPSLVPPSTAALTQPPAIFHAHQDLGFHHFPVGKSGWGEFECSFISYIMLTLLGGGITGGDRQVLGIGDKLPASLFPARRGCGPCRPPEALSSDGFEYLCLDLPKGSWDLNPGVTGVVFSFIHSFNRTTRRHTLGMVSNLEELSTKQGDRYSLTRRTCKQGLQQILAHPCSQQHYS
ncbi:uncharacterized protein LOC130704644 [Balaenoptera acutorostrata]|uniref:Uncharacterized protein LOC130704644 n=1 Tax=Balaenoptera acutorostrata TaxID=9767 RepID=A0ABM3RZI7_BALAC|nr:uncharacterized protein LOC130704644 [Balaenoptera acutorostrata]